MAALAIFHLRLQCNFQKLLRPYRTEKLQPGYMVHWQNPLTENFPKYSKFSIFLQFFRRYRTARARHATRENLGVQGQCNNFFKK